MVKHGQLTRGFTVKALEFDFEVHSVLKVDVWDLNGSLQGFKLQY